MGIPQYYLAFSKAFNIEPISELPRHRKIHDCEINLKADAKPYFGPLYKMSEKESLKLRKLLDENLAKGFIRPSKSKYGAPILFVPKKDGTLRLSVDYRKLNEATQRDSLALPLIDNALDLVRNSKIFTKLDLENAYNLIRIKESDIGKQHLNSLWSL